MHYKRPNEMTYESETVSWIRLFRAFDLDHDGFIPTTDLKRSIREAAYSFGLDPEEVNAMTRNIDSNGDRLIDFAEFCTLVACEETSQGVDQNWRKVLQMFESYPLLAEFSEVQLMSRVKRHRLMHLMFRAAEFVVPRSKRTEPFAYLQKYKCCPPPVFMASMSIIQIAIYIYYTVESGEGVSITGPVPTKSALIFNPHRKEELWRFITYMFIHIGLYHVVFNVLTQLLLGIPLELVHQWRVVVIYVAGVLSGSLLVTAVDRHVFLAGASGGVYALLAAHLAELVMNWSEMEFNWVRAIILAILIGSDAAISIFQRYLVDRTDRVSYVSHIGGFLAGVFLGVVILRNFRFHRWEGKLWWASLFTYLFFVVVSIVFIFGPEVIKF